MNNGVEDNQTNVTAQDPVLTVVDNTSEPSNFSVPVINTIQPATATMQVVENQPMITPVEQPIITPVVEAQPTVVTTPVQPQIAEPIVQQQPAVQIAAVNQSVPNNTVTEPYSFTTPEVSTLTTQQLDAVPLTTTDIPTTPPIQENPKPVKEKKKKSIIPLLLLIIVGLVIFLFYTYTTYKRNIAEANYNCSPLEETTEGKELDLNSTIVNDLYSKVYTSVREDYAEPEFNDTMKLYLAYRQITDFEKYDSNCNMYDNKKMEPYVCNDLQGAKPKAIAYETMLLKWKTMYGENTPMPNNNIRLTNLCIGGYQYIPEREEYVEGYCKQSTAVSVRADKKLISAISYNKTIILTEEVRYYTQENMAIPKYLKNGTYKYLFRLDTNYNYVFVSKTYEQKY